MKTIILSDKVYVSDPCYTPGTWCQAVIENVLPGNYEAIVDKTDNTMGWGNRCSHLFVIHESVSHKKLNWIEHPATIGVDSGQAGIFDFDSYRNDSHPIPKVESDDKFPDEWAKKEGDKWYVNMCDRTLGEESWGTYDRGVVTSSGFGDGSYPLYVTRNTDGQIVGFHIDFLIEEDDIDYGYDE